MSQKLAWEPFCRWVFSHYITTNTVSNHFHVHKFYDSLLIAEVKPLKGQVHLMAFSWPCQVLLSPALPSLCPSPQSGLHCASEAQQPVQETITALA